MNARPSDRAMKAAVLMEIHAACSTQTIGKGAELDKAFPAYDDMLAALKAAVALSDKTVSPLGRTPACQRVYDQCAAAISKAVQS